MKNKLLSTFLTLTFASNLFAQTQLVKDWDYRFGGNQLDDLTCLVKTADGGCILAGSSKSDSNGDRTVPNWNPSTLNPTYDFWIVKIDSLGLKQFDKKYGGIDDDILYSMIKTADGGYLLGGATKSDSSGDMTQQNWTVTSGVDDFWVIKLDSNFTRQWDKRFGGTNNDRLYSMKQTRDGGYILGGTAEEGFGIGDISQPTWGGEDYWIVKIDSVGSMEWNKRYGGTTNDFLESVVLTPDNGFLLCGMSGGPISGDITQASFDTTNNPFNYDIWVVKVDSVGSIQWNKRYGGSKSEQLYSALGKNSFFYLYAYSASGISGNKTVAKCDTSKLSADLWLVKIDLNGNIVWQQGYGGISHEESYSLEGTNDSGFLLGATSYSPISCSKSESNLGQEQTWIIKTDSNGVKQWDKTVLTTGHDELGIATETTDGCYLMANFTLAGIGGDKTQATQGQSDYWIVKYCETKIVEGVNSVTTNSIISISPNPFSSDLSIAIQKQNLNQATFTIHNIVGQVVFNQQEHNLSDSYTKTIDLTFLANGIYVLQIVVDGERTTKKIIKQ